MTDVLDRDLRPILGLGENERALEDGLGEEGEALRGPGSVGGMKALGLGDVFGDFGRVRADVTIARIADGGVGLIGLLDYGSEKAGVLGELSAQDGCAEVDVSEHALQRVGLRAIRSLREEA